MDRKLLNNIVLILNDSEKTFEEIEWELDGSYEPEDIKDALLFLVKKRRVVYNDKTNCYTLN